ncbi:amidohydrolase family protein [Collimonas silvisoli]|uniref:amidohydrolase family protein n=1 Tax=Collimonas silvisoli TaxID=2825884 RepID=UPI001B8AC5BC|nr:amidohydrolase family protein [Collimonas silvisoli]
MTENACDCHIHIYDLTRFALAESATFTPLPATWQEYEKIQSALGISRSLIVQPTGYGFDNRCTLDALRQAGDRARAIVVIPPDIGDTELVALDKAGVCGVRFMMVPGSGGMLQWDMLVTMAKRIAAFGWNINLQLDGRDLPLHEAMLHDLPCKLVIDHNGKFLEPVNTDHPAARSLLRLLEGGNCWVKLAAPYETSKIGAPHYDDVSVLAKMFAKAYPDRCLWASNWPHPNRNPAPDNMALLALLKKWAPSDEIRHKILVTNPAHLYRF